MPEIEIDPRELWIRALQKAGLPILHENDGTRWVCIDQLFDYLMRIDASFDLVSSEPHS